jgi:hypothetical protein
MNTTANIPNHTLASDSVQNGAFESTYGLIVRSEEKGRSIFETAVYALFIVCTAFSIWQSAHQSITLPGEAVKGITSVTAAASQTQGS